MLPLEDYKSIFDAIPGPTLILSPSLHFLAANENYLKETMTQRENIIGKYLFDVFPDNPSNPNEEGVTSLRSSLAKVLAQKTSDTMGILKYDIRNPDTGVFEVRYWSPVNIPVIGPDGNVKLIINSISDVTEFILLQQSTVEMKDRTKEMEAKLYRQMQEIKNVNKELEAFCYSVSHDLRAPIRSLIGFSQIVLERYSGGLQPQAQDFLNRIAISAKRMGLLVDGLLNLSRLNRQILNEGTINLSEIAESIIEGLKFESQRDLEFVCEKNVVAQCDGELLKIVFTNLLGNAWKFTQKQALAKIEFGKIEKSGHTVYFIKDNGAGFQMEYAHKLFGVFQRLHSTDEFEGSGVGLAMVQRIINRHGGKVWAEGMVGKGATFYFTLHA